MALSSTKKLSGPNSVISPSGGVLINVESIPNSPLNSVPFLLSGRNHHRLNRRTKYGCEGSALKIECHEGSAIRVIRANYGRFSLSICNEYERGNFSTNCLEPRSMRTVRNR